MLKEELIQLINDAYELLNGNQKSEFSQNKNLIKEIFCLTKYNLNKEKIRLTVIDSIYSTNMNKFKGAISELSDAFKNISEYDEDLSTAFISYLNNPDKNECIKNIFSGKYGKNSKNSEGVKAVSLISKYAYFLTKFNFPIYDSLMKETIKKLKKELKEQKFFTGTVPSYSSEKGYFELLNKITSSIEGNGVDRFDAFGWLTGKIRKAHKNNPEDASLDDYLIGSSKDYDDFKKKLKDFKDNLNKFNLLD